MFLKRAGFITQRPTLGLDRGSEFGVRESFRGQSFFDGVSMLSSALVLKTRWLQDGEEERCM